MGDDARIEARGLKLEPQLSEKNAFIELFP